MDSQKVNDNIDESNGVCSGQQVQYVNDTPVRTYQPSYQQSYQPQYVNTQRFRPQTLRQQRMSPNQNYRYPVPQPRNYQQPRSMGQINRCRNCLGNCTNMQFCPACGKTCYACNRINHFASACRSSNR